MAMEQPQARKKFAGKKGKGKFGDKKPRDGAEGGKPGMGGRYQPKLLGKSYFQRKKGCPFSGPKAPKIDYKDVRMLQRYMSDYGKILPRHLTGVCAKKQRELATAIHRARMLSLLAFTGVSMEREERRAEKMAQRAREGGEGRSFGGRSFDRTPRHAPAEVIAEGKGE